MAIQISRPCPQDGFEKMDYAIGLEHVLGGMSQSNDFLQTREELAVKGGQGFIEQGGLVVLEKRRQNSQFIDLGPVLIEEKVDNTNEGPRLCRQGSQRYGFSVRSIRNFGHALHSREDRHKRRVSVLDAEVPDLWKASKNARIQLVLVFLHKESPESLESWAALKAQIFERRSPKGGHRERRRTSKRSLRIMSPPRIETPTERKIDCADAGRSVAIDWEDNIVVKERKEMGTGNSRLITVPSRASCHREPVVGRPFRAIFLTPNKNSGNLGTGNPSNELMPLRKDADLINTRHRRIDKGFDQSVGPSHADTGGGFIFSDPDTSDGQRLDLPPDDEQVLTVFKNAASGWQVSSNEMDLDGGAEEESLYVSRDDWRSVLAVLLEPGGGDEYDDSDDAPPRDSYANSPDEDDDDEVDPADEYHSPEASDDDSDSDEYMEEPAPSTSRAKRTRRRSSSSSSLQRHPKKLTARQRLDTYGLLFPFTPQSNQRITIKDIQRLTKLIGDTLKSDEIIEMLDESSTAPDKSMS
ncbi:hypothetical protein FB45DRAFT_879050 [Roridomyces roridus]|uniref:Uncharacterized protein n=1 Tax=Roridomyces roridus TaxID=1738132 RepID=A0AAD7B018_9AGAR|nr:hypothetical protein FB45DRAFT_879050 [Roridomyces roridus]